MPEGNGSSLRVVKTVKATVIRCIYHAKEARYRINVLTEENLVIVQCLECKPPAEICRFAIDTTRKV